MKLTAIILLAACLQVSAKSYTQNITISEKNAALEKVFSSIKKQTGYTFWYKTELLDEAKKVSISVKNASLETVLDLCTSGQTFTWEIIGKTVVLRHLEKNTLISNPPPGKAPPIDIRGTVTDADGKPLEGVSVIVKGDTKGVSTDANGNFIISVADNTTLRFSYIGFDPQEIPVRNKTTINVKLSLTASSLNDIVVIGYGTQKKRNVTGSVSKLVNENFDERAITRVDQALVGQLAGVTVKQSTGIPGKAFSIQVRGSGSISGGNEPLYVLDGFPLSVNASNAGNGSFTTGNPLDNINPNDIESIEVLKDASAAAIYGSRASNGVVLITTKRGQTGKPLITFNGYAGYNEAAKKLNMMNGDQWIEQATEVINATYVAQYGSVGATANDDRATRLLRNGGAFNANYILDPRWSQPGHPGLSYIDWQDAIQRKGQMQNYQVSVSGGTDAVKYFMSGNYANQESFIVNVGYKAYSLRANLEVNASKKLKFGLNIAPTFSITQDPGVDGQNSLFHQALSLAPVQEDTMGLLPNTGKNGQYIYSSTTNSPLGKLTYNKGTTKRYRTLGTLYGELQIIKGLSFRSSINLDNTDNIASTYVSYLTAGTQATRTFSGTNNLLAATSGTYNSYRRQTFVNENTLNYTKNFDRFHSNLNVLAGYAYNWDRLDRTTMSSNGGFNSAVIQTLSSAVAVTGNTQSNQNVLISYFGRLQYGYKDKYLLSASLRRDGSSRFGIFNLFGVFPSASLKWIASDEKFMKAIPVISDLKLRVSYGVNGNNNLPNDYPWASTIGSSPYPLGTTPVTVNGQAPNVLANPDLKWERSETYDIGIDFGILKNRITGSFDYYNKLNTDLLLNVQVPAATGFQSFLTNIGSVRNIGQELEINSRNIVGKLFQWTTSVNVTHNTNKIEALAPGQTQIIIPNGNNVTSSILRVGQALNSIYVLQTIGFLSAKDLANNVARYGPQAEGDLRYQDTNNDGIISEADKVIVGHPNPNYTYGVTNTFRYKGFDLTVLVQGQSGGAIFSELGRALTRPGQGRSDNHPASFVNRWRSPDNQGEGRFGKAYSTYYSPITSATDWLYSSDYIRVRNITLGYNLKGLFKTQAIRGARAYLTLENFFGHDKYTNGLNPEAANTSASSNTAYPIAGDYGGMPLAKSLIFGLNITF
ncbi:MAG: TonB-dependent receptor [Ferruginibacter sp.]|nr:TonB-dependent receptor [Ferruginibacter sp.]